MHSSCGHNAQMIDELTRMIGFASEPLVRQFFDYVIAGNLTPGRLGLSVVRGASQGLAASGRPVVVSRRSIAGRGERIASR